MANSYGTDSGTEIEIETATEKLAAVSLTQYENLWSEAGVENAARK